MYVDDLIKELEQWKAPTAEITVDGWPINRVASSESRGNLVLVSNSFVTDEERDEFESKILDLECDLNSAEDEKDEMEDRIDDFKDVSERALKYLNKYKEYLESNGSDSKDLENLIDEIEGTMDDYRYEY